MCMCCEGSDRGRCGCCRVPHRPHLASLTPPTNSHTRSPIQTPKKYHLTIASSHHLAASASEKRALALPHLTPRRSVGSWPPELARSAFDAHWPPPEAWYLGIIRIASSGRICPLTCALHTVHSTHCTLYTLCALHTVRSTHCTLNTLCALHTVHSTHCALYTLYTLLTVHSTHCALYTLCTLHAVHSTHCTLYTLHALHTVHSTHCALYTLCTQHTVHSTHCTLYTLYALLTVHSTHCALYSRYALHTVHSTHCTLYTLAWLAASLPGLYASLALLLAALPHTLLHFPPQPPCRSVIAGGEWETNEQQPVDAKAASAEHFAAEVNQPIRHRSPQDAALCHTPCTANTLPHLALFEPTHLLVIDLRALLSVAVSATLPPTMTLQW